MDRKAVRMSVAPMLCVTDGPYRTLARMLSRRTLLYTEMLPADLVIATDLSVPLNTLTHFPNPASLRISESTWADSAGPLAVQLGGSDPHTMATAAARIVEAFADASLREININCGCPSGTVAKNAFGASLMRIPSQVQAIAAAVREAVPNDVEVTVKIRLGVDDHDSYAQLTEFVSVVSAPPASVNRFIVHARKAILGLNTADNRLVPPLRRDWVLSLAADFPDLVFELNGGVKSLDEVEGLLSAGGGFQGVMVGRAAREDPWSLLADADRRIFGCLDDTQPTTRQQVAVAYAEYADGLLAAQLEASAAAAELESRKRPHERRELRKRLYRPLRGLLCGIEQAERALEKSFERKACVTNAVQRLCKLKCREE